nr:probable aquaporin TIP-type [Tanacetum cinerariifolium]
MVKLAFGSIGDSFSGASIKSYLAEFIATLLFVFAGVGSAIAFGKLTSDAALDPAGLVAIAIAHALALFVGVSMAANISGGHLNPAVTFVPAADKNNRLFGFHLNTRTRQHVLKEHVQKHHERHGAISCSQVHNIDDNAVETIANNCHDLQVMAIRVCGCGKAAFDKALKAIGCNYNQLQSINIRFVGASELVMLEL